MSYFGVQLFVPGTTFDVVNSIAAEFILDTIVVSGNGSKTYSVPDGFSIQARAYREGNLNAGRVQPSVSVSGNTVSWSPGMSTDSFTVIVWCM